MISKNQKNKNFSIYPKAIQIVFSIVKPNTGFEHIDNVKNNISGCEI